MAQETVFLFLYGLFQAHLATVLMDGYSDTGQLLCMSELPDEVLKIFWDLETI